VGPEGELRVGLRVSDGHVERVDISSTRPDIARSLLQGRTRLEVQAAVPLLFSICGRSQAAASALACAAATGEPTTPDALAHFSATVSAETVRECAWRTLLDWPKDIGELPTEAAIAAARSSLSVRSGAPADGGARSIALAVFGVPADEWLALESLAGLDRWIDAGQTASARVVCRVRDDDAAAGHTPRLPPPGAALLDNRRDTAWMAALSAACEADAAFERHPTWNKAPAETGALARMQADPLIAELARRSASRVVARIVARLRELALLLEGRISATLGCATLARGAGVGWVENARGLLVHLVRLGSDRVSAYRIVAPTEWNFHPDGTLVSELSGWPADDLDALQRMALRHVHSLDPCVACRVEFDHA
jgi:hypothetical protein